MAKTRTLDEDLRECGYSGKFYIGEGGKGDSVHITSSLHKLPSFIPKEIVDRSKMTNEFQKLIKLMTGIKSLEIGEVCVLSLLDITNDNLRVFDRRSYGVCGSHKAVYFRKEGDYHYFVSRTKIPDANYLVVYKLHDKRDIVQSKNVDYLIAFPRKRSLTKVFHPDFRESINPTFNYGKLEKLLKERSLYPLGEEVK